MKPTFLTFLCYAFLLFLSQFAEGKQKCSKCDFIVKSSSGTYTTIDNNALNLKAGSTICFSASRKYDTGFFVRNFKGKKAKPFVFTNCDGVATIRTSSHGLLVESCKHFRITGSGWAPKNKYGLRIRDTGFGIAIRGGSSNCEVDHVEIFNNVGHACITAKSDPRNPENLNELWPQYYRSNFEMVDVFLHDNYLHECAREGFYVGYNNYELVLSDGGRAHEIRNAKIYNNRVENSEWDSIQLGCSPNGAEVFGNTVVNYATAGSSNQDSGIVLLSGFKGKVYSNFVSSSSQGGIGILYHGNGDTDIFNNVVVAGWRGISLSVSEARTNPGSYHKIDHNTVIAPSGDRGINVFITSFTASNTGENNVIVYGGNNGWECHSGAQGSSNICANDIQADWKFVDANNDDYRLQSGSSLINAGQNGVRSRDFTFKKRKNTPDIGAYEFKAGSKKEPTKYTVLKPSKGPKPKIKNIGGSQATVTWTPLYFYSVDKYDVRYKHEGGNWKKKSTTGTKIKLKKLNSSKRYYTQVRAKNYAGTGSWSKTVSFNTI